jgi:hypothetical protein
LVEHAEQPLALLALHARDARDENAHEGANVVGETTDAYLRLVDLAL